MRQFFFRALKVALIFAAFWALYFNLKSPAVVESDDCGLKKEYAQKLFPGIAEFKKINDKCCYEIYNSEKNALGKVLYMRPDESIPNGYGGKFRIVVGITNDNKVLGVEMGENHETPGFTDMVRSKGFFSQWTGLPLTEAMQKKVDTVTGATMSTSCIKCMVQKNISEYLGAKAEIEKTSGFSIVFYVSILLLIYSLISFFIPGATAKFRIYHMTLMTVFLGFLGGYALSIESFKNFFITGSASTFTIVLFALAVTIPLFTGRNFYCSHVCPFGAIQELAGKIPLKKMTVTAKVLKIMTLVKKLILLTVFIMLSLKITGDYTRMEPFSAFQFNAAGISALIIAGIMLIFSLFVSKPWCRLFCPTGTIFNIIVEKKAEKKAPSGQ